MPGLRRALPVPSVASMRGRRGGEGLSPRALARVRGGRLRGGAPGAAVRPERGEVPGGEVPGGVVPGREYVPRREEVLAGVRPRGAPARHPPAGEPGQPGRHRRLSPPRPRWVLLPASLVGARWQPGRAAVLGVVAVALLAAAVFGVRVAWARAADQAAVVVPGGGARAGPVGVSSAVAAVGLPAGAAGVPSPVGADAAPGAEVVVHVVGQVRRPGVRHLPAGSRVADAVAAAGGATSKADLGAVNLARVLVDGEQVRVPARGEAVAPTGAGGAAGGPPGGGRVPLNTADAAALDTLPGVGPVLAARIVEWRTSHGRFTSVDELAEVSGIGEKLLAQLRPLVTV